MYVTQTAIGELLKSAWLLLILIFVFNACEENKQVPLIPEPQKKAYMSRTPHLDKEAYYDKVLGALVGSAIGDAMGASTEMWHRRDIRLKYGYITGLTPATREQSAEGTWEHNLGPGATTDDTRWKYLMVVYMSRFPNTMNVGKFASFITAYYEEVAAGLEAEKIASDPDVLSGRLEQVDWIREWARVALAYEDSPEAYQNALNRFYGGEMSCAGMLYSPMFGLITPDPETAYTQAYQHAMFDIGYAKDISSSLAGLTQMALYTNNMDSILNTAVFVDPMRYQDSRLVGRISSAIAETSRKNAWLSRELTLVDSIHSDNNPEMLIPKSYPGSRLEWLQQEFLYNMLEENERAIPFHAGEIWEILITGLEFGQGDFTKTLQFIVNYGRDNDTVAAIAGMVLGARNGFTALPVELRSTVLRTNKEELGIDLEALARQLASQEFNAVPNGD